MESQKIGSFFTRRWIILFIINIYGIYNSQLNGNIVTCVGSPGSGAREAARIASAALSANCVLAELPAQFANNFKAVRITL